MTDDQRGERIDDDGWSAMRGDGSMDADRCIGTKRRQIIVASA